MNEIDKFLAIYGNSNESEITMSIEDLIKDMPIIDHKSNNIDVAIGSLTNNYQRKPIGCLQVRKPVYESSTNKIIKHKQ